MGAIRTKRKTWTVRPKREIEVEKKTERDKINQKKLCFWTCQNALFLCFCLGGFMKKKSRKVFVTFLDYKPVYFRSFWKHYIAGCQGLVQLGVVIRGFPG